MKTSEILTLMKDLKEGKRVFDNDYLNDLYQPPNKEWLKKHPFVKSEYLPIDKVELLLDLIMKGKWKVEVLNIHMASDRVLASVRLHYFHPVDQEWQFHDGAAIKTIQKEADREEKALYEELKRVAYSQSNPIEKAKYLKALYELQEAKPVRLQAWEAAAQIAISEAIKDAADHFGPQFGRDNNRKDTVAVIESAEPAPYTQDPLKVQTTADDFLGNI